MILGLFLLKQKFNKYLPMSIKCITLSEVVFEGDSETITKALNSALPCLSPFGHIIDDVKTLALNFVSASFVHVKRQVNAVADRLAKAAKCIPCPHIWSDDLPCNVQQLVTDDSISVDKLNLQT